MRCLSMSRQLRTVNRFRVNFYLQFSCLRCLSMLRDALHVN
jgi:hypothetical protein